MSRPRRLAVLRRRARCWRRYPNHGPSSERRRYLVLARRRVRGRSSHLAFVPVVLRGRPGTSACSSAGEPTTSKPDRPRMSAHSVAPTRPRLSAAGPNRPVIAVLAASAVGGEAEHRDSRERLLLALGAN